MATDRILKSNLPTKVGSSDSLSFVRVSSNNVGLTLDYIDFQDLPVVKHAKSGVLGRRATLITDIRQDPDKSDQVICDTTDVVLPHDENDLNMSDNTQWKSV